MKKQVRVIVSGKVQGAAYRDCVERIAYGLHITGTVRNLEDETVEIICEGEAKDLSEFLKRIQIKQWPIMVEKIRPSYKKPTSEFSRFQTIRTELTNRDIIDRLDLGMNYMGEMNSHLGTMDSHIVGMDSHVQRMDSHVQRMDSHVQRMDSHVQRMDSHVQRMDSNMGNHFKRIDKKYGEFGNTMKGMAKEMKKSGKDAKATSAHIKGMASDIKAIKNATTVPKKGKIQATA
jgi:acylphosphatase